MALIMDSNGHWAQQRGLPHLAGHRAGAESAHHLLGTCLSFGLKIVTLYLALLAAQGVEVVVTKVLHPAQGRMIFARVEE